MPAYTFTNANLVSLNLGHCSEFVEALFSKEKITFPKLRHLDVSECGSVGDTALECIARGHVDLETCILAECVHLTADGIVTLCKRCPTLKTLVRF